MLPSSSPSSSAASADAPLPETDLPETDLLHPPYSPPRADLPTPAHEPYNSFAHPPYVPPPPLPVPGALPVLTADELELGLVERLDRPSSSTASSPFALENDAAAQPPEPEEPVVHDTVEENKVVAGAAVVGVSEDHGTEHAEIPPRPHGNRLESIQQQSFHHFRPISTRLGEAHGLLSTWRRILDQHLANSMSRFEGPPEPSTARHASRLGQLTARLRARKLQREAEIPTSVVQPGNSTSDLPMRSSSPFPSEGMGLLRHIGLEDSERLATAVSELRRIARPSPYWASASSNPPNPEPVDGTHIATALAADQASNSSTMSVIQEDVAFTESAGEASNAGSSRSLRRTRGSDALGSLDVDGGDLHQNKRRRLN